MKVPRRNAISLSPAVVGTVHSAASLRAARKAGLKDCDWLELRIDNFLKNIAELKHAAGNLRLPCIVTVRHPAEGGAAAGITPGERRALYGEFLGGAGLVDIELRSIRALRGVVEEAKGAGVGVILSHHDFKGTPGREKLRELARRAEDAGAEIFKVATLTRTGRELARLIEFLADEKGRLPLSVMGMGPLGRVSRLALARGGSCLNYGYLGAANASGQWPAAVLKARIAELEEPL